MHFMNGWGMGFGGGIVMILFWILVVLGIVYLFDWHPDRVEFYIDDKRVWTSTKAIPKRDMQIALHIYTIDTWDEVQYPPEGEVIQMTDWVAYREFK